MNTYIQVLKRTRYSNVRHISKLKGNKCNEEQDLCLIVQIIKKA